MEPPIFTFPFDVHGWLNPEEGHKLFELAHNKTVLELGSYLGRSTICMAQSAKWVMCSDTFDGQATLEPRQTLNEFIANLQRYGVLHRCMVLTGDNRITIPFLKPHSFDMAFIDADHSAEALRQNIRDVEPLVKPGGILVFHDYNQFDRPDVAPVVDAWRGDRTVGVVTTLAWVKIPTC